MKIGLSKLKRLGAVFALGAMMATCSVGAMSASAFQQLTEAEFNQISGSMQLGDASGSGFAANDYQFRDASGNYWYIKAADYTAAKGTASKRSNSGLAQNNSAGVVDSLDQLEAGLQVTGDSQTAMTAISGFIPVISFILGLIIVLISIGMTIFSAFDICYIAFPVFRNKCEEAKASGQGAMVSSKPGKNGETKLRFVSDDAQYAITASETTQTGKNPFVIYFKHRILAYLLLAITVFILLTGNITILTNLAVRLVAGILDIIAGF